MLTYKFKDGTVVLGKMVKSKFKPEKFSHIALAKKKCDELRRNGIAANFYRVPYSYVYHVQICETRKRALPESIKVTEDKILTEIKDIAGVKNIVEHYEIPDMLMEGKTVPINNPAPNEERVISIHIVAYGEKRTFATIADLPAAAAQAMAILEEKKLYQAVITYWEGDKMLRQYEIYKGHADPGY